jgi:RNA polymerase sporulation-specific sigma factor
MDKTRELLRLTKEGNEAAREQIILNNVGLIWSVVRRFTNRGYESEDLFQIGSIGLMKAVDKFDLSYDVKFSTYAVPMITGEIRRFLRDDGMIKVSRSLKENVYKIMKAREKFCQQYQREATIEEISEITKITREEIVTSLEASNEVESIHQSAYQKDGSEISLLDKLSKGENESEKVVDHVLLLITYPAECISEGWQ